MGPNGSMLETSTVTSHRIVAIHSMARWKTHMESHKQSNQLMVIDFTAVWCGPCRMMNPVLNELADTFTNVVFVKIDVDELMEVAREWGVEAMPTFVLLKNGKEVGRVVGAGKEELKKKVEQNAKTNFGNIPRPRAQVWAL